MIDSTVIFSISDMNHALRCSGYDLVINLEKALEVFQEHAKSGTVRGVGTPEIQLVDASGTAPGPEGQGGFGGAFGFLDLALLSALAAVPWAAASGRAIHGRNHKSTAAGRRRRRTR